MVQGKRASIDSYNEVGPHKTSAGHMVHISSAASEMRCNLIPGGVGLKQRYRCEPLCTGGCVWMAPSLLCVIGRDCLRNEEERGALQTAHVAGQIQCRRTEETVKLGSLM